MTSMMKDVVNRGTAAKVRARGFKANVAGKTGTSRDGWFAGYTPNLVCVVYVGFDDGSELGMTGARLGAPHLDRLHDGGARRRTPSGAATGRCPPGVEQVEIDPQTGMLARPTSTAKRTELFITGTAPTGRAKHEPEEPTTPAKRSKADDGRRCRTRTPDAIEVPPLPEATPPPARRAPRPATTGAATTQERDPTRLTGTRHARHRPDDGPHRRRRPAPSSAPRPSSIGTEPRRRCGPQYPHRAQTSSPPRRARAASRRNASPPL